MKNIREILGKFTGRNVVAIPTVLVQMTGDWTLAALLNQLIYWSGRTSRRDGYIFKSLKDWEKELIVVTDYSIRKFKKLPYVETKIAKANGIPTTYYRINFEIFLKELESLKSTNGNGEINEPGYGEINESINIDYLTENTNKSLINNSNKSNDEPDISHREMIRALEEITLLDMKIKRNAGRIVKASKELREAGYTPEHLRIFQQLWKKDWRYKNNQEPPTLNVILSEIGKTKKVTVSKNKIDYKIKLAKETIERAQNEQ